MDNIFYYENITILLELYHYCKLVLFYNIIRCIYKVKKI